MKTFNHEWKKGFKIKQNSSTKWIEKFQIVRQSKAFLMVRHFLTF